MTALKLSIHCSGIHGLKPAYPDEGPKTFSFAEALKHSTRDEKFILPLHATRKRILL